MNNSVLPLNGVTDDDAGNYAVVVTNSVGVATSRLATLVISPPMSRIINLSVRTSAGTASETLIVGFVVGGDGGSPKPVLLRGIGPTLAVFGFRLPHRYLKCLVTRIGAFGREFHL